MDKDSTTPPLEDSGSGTLPGLRALILDDDEWALRLIRYVLEEGLPGVEIVERRTPDAHGEFDIYIVDNDFGGSRCAAEIVPSIRARRPAALVVAFSATLDRTTLKALLNAGCNSAFEKGRPNDLQALSQIVCEYARSRPLHGETRRGVAESAKAIRELIHEWNVRLSRDEAELHGQ
jgi:DNA-binding NarL/FixJ family response regulator